METHTTSELENLLLKRISGRVQNLRILRIDGRLVVEGTVRTFHAKQLVTHAAMELAPGEDWVNSISVERAESW